MKIIEASTTGAPVSAIDLGQRKGTVVFEADTQAELHHADVRHKAVQYAQSKGLISAAIRDEGHVYPVTPEGRMADPMQSLPEGSKFRIDITLGSTH